MRYGRIIVSCALTLAAAACGSDGPSAPTSHTPVDLNAVLSQLAAGGLSSAAASASSGSVAVPAFAVGQATNCTYTASTGGFVCPSTTTNGLTIAMTYYLLDASDHSQSAFDANTTAAVRSVMDVSGTITTSSDTLGGTIALTEHVDMTMSGLLTATHVINGTTRGHFDMAISKPSAMHDVTDMSITTTNLTVPANATASNPWPTSGTVTTDETSNISGSGIPSTSLTLHSVMTFNGSGTATLVIGISGTPSVTCKVDLTGKTQTTCS